VRADSSSFVLTQKNQKVKAVHPSLENYTPFHCLHPNSQTPFTDSFAKNPMAELTSPTLTYNKLKPPMIVSMHVWMSPDPGHSYFIIDN
jgi:hypothetical protein